MPTSKPLRVLRNNIGSFVLSLCLCWGLGIFAYYLLLNLVWMVLHAINTASP